MFFRKKEKQNTKRKRIAWLPKWLRRPLRWCYTLFKLGFVCFLLVASYYTYLAFQYDINKVTEIPARTVVIDSQAQEHAVLFGNMRRLASYEELPSHLLESLYAREDLDFESHFGVKPKGLIRATLRNIKDRKFTQGGSTLTMQLVKNTYNNRADSIHRKLLEIALALRVEYHYEKQDIVTHYLNRIYFGSGCYGIEEASQKYFGKTVSDLHPGESAMLVGIIRGPALFNPVKDYDKAIAQRDQVLSRRVNEKQITEAEAEEIKQLPIIVAPKSNSGNRKKSYTLQAVQRHLDVILKEKEIDKNGLTIETTIDPELVQKVDSFARNLPAELHGASVILDSKTGAILAINGGKDVQSHPWNIALDSNTRFLGSIYDPFIYLAALEHNRNPIKNHPIETGRQLDVEELIRFSKELKLDGTFPTDESLLKGQTNASALTLATSYTIIGNQGSIPHTFIIKEVKNAEGETLYENPTKQTEVASKGNISELLKLYSKKNTLKLKTINAAKTDAWSIHAGPKQTRVLWLGRLDGKPIKLSRKKLTSIQKDFEKLFRK